MARLDTTLQVTACPNGIGSGDGSSENWLVLSKAEMASEDYPPGWTNTLIAEVDGKIVGAASGYMMPIVEENGEVASENRCSNRSLRCSRKLPEIGCSTGWRWTPQYKGRGLAHFCLTPLSKKPNRLAQPGPVSWSGMPTSRSCGSIIRDHSRGFQQRGQRPYIPFNETSQTQYRLLLSAPVT